MQADLDIAVAPDAGSRVLDLATNLAGELEQLGRRVSVIADRPPPVVAGRTTCIFVPHAGFDEWASAHAEGVATRLRSTLAISTGVISLEAALALRGARGVLALLPATRHAFRLAGVHASPLPLAWGGAVDDHEDRDLDVVVCEGWNPDRWRILARCARVLDGRVCDLRASYVGGTRAGVEHLPGSDGRRALLRRARVALVVGNGRSLDLLAALEAAACGAVIVTDARIDLAPFAPGVHLVRADERAIPAALDALLRDPERVMRIRAAASSLVRRHPLSVAAQVVAAAVDARPAAIGRTHSMSTGHVAPVASDAVHAPSSAVVESLAAVRQLGRRVEHLERLAGRSTRDGPRIVHSGSWEAATAELSVVIPLHDYEDYIEDACRSVAAARDVRLELVVVDDASRDAGADRVDAFLRRRPELPAALVRLDSNVGIAEARNRGASLARSPLLLFLDADDELLPHGPALLRDALERDADASFAYGLLAVEGPEGPRALLNAEPWNPDLLRDGNYVNALALVRAGAYRDVGGYRADGPLELGWEDYDFWLRMAEADLRGAHVRQFVARYRAHTDSRTTTADTIASELMSYMRTRHPRILGERPA